MIFITRYICCLFMVLSIMIGGVKAPNIGSNANVSLQPTANLAGGGNNILGFGVMLNGFNFASSTTTCTFAGFFPVSSTVSLNGGTLSLAEDFICFQPVAFPTGGTILGNQSLFAIGETTTDFALTATFNFDSTMLRFDTNTRLYSTLQFAQGCKICGKHGKVLTLNNGSALVVRPNSQLIIEDITIRNVGRTNLRCLMDNGSIVLRNVILESSANYTFSRGSILFDQDVIFTGTTTFAYTTGVGSTINSLSTLMFDHDTTLSYAPRRANGSLLSMTDQTSCLYLSGCTLFSTYTGLQLQTGTLLLDDQVTVTSTSRNSGEALLLNSSLTTKVMGGASVYMYGRIKYQ